MPRNPKAYTSRIEIHAETFNMNEYDNILEHKIKEALLELRRDYRAIDVDDPERVFYENKKGTVPAVRIDFTVHGVKRRTIKPKKESENDESKKD